MTIANVPRIANKPQGEPWSNIVPAPVKFGAEHVAAAAGLLRTLDSARLYGIDINDADREIAQEMYCADVSAAMRIGVKVDSVLPREDGNSWFDFMLVSALERPETSLAPADACLSPVS